MQLKYHHDIQWHDLPKIERPSMAGFSLRAQLSSPRPKLLTGHLNDPLREIYKTHPYSREIDPNALKRLCRKLDKGSVLLVHNSESDIFFPAFIWEKDENLPDKGHWTLCYHLLSVAEYHFHLLLNTVKKPQQRSSIKKTISEPLFPGANMADTRRAIANTAIDTTNTVTDVARKRELAEYADRYPQLNSGATNNPLEIKQLEYDNEPYGEFAGTIAGALGMLGTRKPSRSLLSKNNSVYDIAPKSNSFANEVDVYAKFSQNTANRTYRDLNLSIHERGLAAQEKALAESADWVRADGSIWWPPYDGAIPGTQRTMSLLPASSGSPLNLVDRYGKSSGSYVAPSGTPLKARALAETPADPPKIYSVEAIIDNVEASNTIGWFGQRGTGPQYKLPQSVRELIYDQKLGKQ